MNILLLEPDELNDGCSVITDHRATHIINTIKPNTGDSLRAGVLNGMTGSAHILDISDQSVAIKFFAEKQPPAPPDISLIIALPRPKAFRRILFGAVSCGVKDIHVINSWRVEKSYWESPYIQPENIDKYSKEALSQSKDTVMPNVVFHRFFMGFINDALPNIPSNRVRYIAHPYGADSAKPSAPAVVAIGPEGGFIDKEVDTFIRHDFKPFTTGERTLTTEHFVPYILGSLIK